ncbi:MAG: mandelate racemase/muconate lactonizing enzyme family protein [Candidatus Jordarchaeum sp.]|uniref:mandelate racemase/muconate lactonizing enzyme family protein n=1 Tax=Candidatus Jordarchaeum sp. TaxID=2823881 RepID=UPI00404AB37F
MVKVLGEFIEVKITEVKAEIIRLPFSIKIGSMPRINASGTLVTIKTDEDIEGYGLSHFSLSDEVQVDFIEGALSKLLKKKDPFMLENIWREMYNNTWRIQFGIGQSISAVEVALWDIIGKSLKMPIYKLLGGYRDKVKAYASFAFALAPKAAVGMAKAAVERGFKAVKLRIGEGLKQDEEIIKAVREEYPDLGIMADANSAYESVKEAAELAGICESYDLIWLEEALPSDNLIGLSELRARSNIEIAGGENDFGLRRFREILEAGAYDIIQPDATRSGGILQVKKICALAEAFGIRAIPHIFGFGPIMTANIHVIASNYNSDWMEYPFYPPEFYLLKTPIPIEDGYAVVPQEPGLGVELDWESIEKYKVK